MPLDALCLSGIIHELNTALSGARVDKIYQPGRDEVILALRTQSTGNVRLLLSAALPECFQAILQQYVLALNARALMEQEAMFQAAFAAAKELS